MVKTPSVEEERLPTVSVVIAAHNRELFLPRCLEALAQSVIQPLECIVVDDGSADRSAAIANGYGTKVISTGRQSGPARARNLGVSHARGDIILFLDSDVCAHQDTIARIVDQFQQHRGVDAVIGAYDDAPDVEAFWSQYRNLLHCFTHRSARREASTFWCGCGAVRRPAFLAAGGFDPSYDRPAVEDIEFGARVISGGGKILLDADIRVKHLKRWTFWSMIRTDILDRGIPWARLILRNGSVPDDLNVRWSQRFSVALAGLMICFACLGRPVGSGLCFLFLLGLNAPFYKFLWSRRGMAFVMRAAPVHVLFHICCGISFTAALTMHLLSTARQIFSALPRPRMLD